MNLEFKSKKWDKEIISINNVKIDYEKDLINFINKVNQTVPKDYRWLYAGLAVDYELIARKNFLENKEIDMIKYTYLSSLAFVILKKLETRGIETKYKNLENNIDDLEYAVCKLIAVDCYEIALDVCEGSITGSLFIKDEKKARYLIEQLPNNESELISIYYNEPIFLKNIYNAILDKDEKAFNNALEKRIRKYRKNAVGYTTFIDYTSIGLIKIAYNYGLNCNIKIAEIPDCFFETINIESLKKLKLPMQNELRDL